MFPRNLRPWALLSRVFNSSRASFVEWVGELNLICIRVPHMRGELEEGLAEIADAPPTSWHAGSGRTGVGTVVVPISEGFLRAAAAADDARVGASNEQLRQTLATSPWWVMPLSKRQAFSLERLRIGRSAENDLVLRHASVSKNHAFIEFDDRDLFYLGDEGSTNGTQINGRTLEPGGLEVVTTGDILRFGDVECILVEPARFWDALQFEGA